MAWRGMVRCPAVAVAVSAAETVAAARVREGQRKTACGRFGFGKLAFVGNRARSAREGRDQWP